MATSDLYEQWEKRVEQRGALQGKAKGLALGEAKGLALGEAKGLALGEAKGKAEGLALGVVRSLAATYETRFGPMSSSLRKALAKVVVPESTDVWVKLFVTASAEEIAAAIRKKQPPAR